MQSRITVLSTRQIILYADHVWVFQCSRLFSIVCLRRYIRVSSDILHSRTVRLWINWKSQRSFLWCHACLECRKCVHFAVNLSFSKWDLKLPSTFGFFTKITVIQCHHRKLVVKIILDITCYWSRFINSWIVPTIILEFSYYFCKIRYCLTF